jgi:ABC-2 type transport system ATP-binding protein
VRRTATALLTAVLTAGGVGALAAPASAAGPITPRHLWITVKNLGPEHRTCRIDADLYTPQGVDALHRAPALLATNGFGGTKADQADLAQGMGEQGYVTLSYTGLGFVDKNVCPITLDDREHDGAAASQLLRFLGGDPSIAAEDQTTHQPVHVNQVIRDDGNNGTRHDPAVGMVGGSYGGQIQFAAAAYEHEHGTNRLDTIVPIITWNDLSYSLDPNNGALPGGTARSGSVSSNVPGAFKYQWSVFFSGEGFEQGLQDSSALASNPASFQAYVANKCPNFSTQVCTALTEVATQGYPSQTSIAFLRHASVASYIRDIKIPTFLAQGEADTLFNLQESVATYTKLKAQGTPVSMDWQSWGHSNSTPVPGELDKRHPLASYQGRQLVAWFNHYVKRTGAQPPLDFRYFRDWVFASTQSITKAYGVASSFPVGCRKTFYLSDANRGFSTTLLGKSVGGGTLVTNKADVVPGTSGYASTAPFGPNYTETSAVESSLNPEPQVSDPPGSSIRFVTPALTSGLNVVGSPRLTVQLQSSAAATQAAGPGGELVIFAKVYDIGPDGTVELPRRLISPARIADVTKPVTIELPGIVHRFAPGHQLAIVLAGGDLAYRGSTVPQEVTLTTGGTNVQQLTIPVVG